MPFSTAQRLQSLGVATPLARELGAQIDSGTYNYRRLMWSGMPVQLAQIVATTPFNAIKAVELGMIPDVAKIRAGGGTYSWSVASLSPSLWYDASDTATISATAGAVDSWANKGSMAGSDAIAAGVARPVTGTRTQNGLNVLDFDGTNSIMTVAGDALNIANGINTLIFISESDTAGAQIVIGGTTAGTRWGPILNAGGIAGRVDSVSNSASVTQSTTGQDLTGPLTFAMRRAPSQGVQGHLNGVRFGTTAAVGADVVLTAMRIGGTAINAQNRFDGKICEILAWNRSLSVDEMAKVLGYLRAKWGAKALTGLLDEWATDDPRTVSHKQNVVAHGDSLTFGTGATDPATKSWPYLLEQSAGRRVFKDGVPGSTSQQIKNRVIVNDDYRDRIPIFFAGRNDYGVAGQVETSIAQMVAYYGVSKYIVMTVLNGNAAQSGAPSGTEYLAIKTINDNSKATYPNNVLDIRQQLVDAGAPTGPYPDPTRYALDEWPNQLRTDPSNDPIHLNDPGYQFIHDRVKSFIDGKGW